MIQTDLLETFFYITIIIKTTKLLNTYYLLANVLSILLNLSFTITMSLFHLSHIITLGARY